MKEINRAVLDHWLENKDKAENETLELDNIEGSNCEWCIKYLKTYFNTTEESVIFICKGCPLNEINEGCNKYQSQWKKVSRCFQLNQETQLIKEIERFIFIIKKAIEADES